MRPYRNRLIIVIVTVVAGWFYARSIPAQTKDVAPRQIATGSSLPATCTVGQIFFLSSAMAGENQYGCTATDVWTLQSGGGSPGATGPTGPTGASGPSGVSGPSGPSGATGATGATGPTGASGASGPAGTSVNWTGAWLSGTTYSVDDGVSDVGVAYVSLMNSNLNHIPASSPTYWQVISQVGAIGPTGPSGPSGPSGVRGATGPTGPSGATGPTGATGGSGPSGPSGPSGTNGTNGSNGASGPSGPTGSSGPSGPSGPTGTSAAGTTPVALTYVASGTTVYPVAGVFIGTGTVTLTHNTSTSLSLTNIVSGGVYSVVMKQDGTGGGTSVTLGTGGTGCSVWLPSTISTSSTANAVDILTFLVVGTSCYANLNHY